MRSETSYFNPTVFANDCKRYWPLTAGYTLLWLLLLPLTLFSELTHDPRREWIHTQYSALSSAVGFGYVLAFCFGILFAMAMFAYLTNPRATNGLHALPARRETLYITHYLAGLCCQIVPQVVTILLTLAVLARRGAADARLAGLMLVGMCLPTLFFYSFGVLCMVFTGQILTAPVFYGILNVLAVSVEYLLTTFAGNFLYGWGGSFDARLKYFSPAALPLFGDMPIADYLNNIVPRADGSTLYKSYAVTIEHAWLLWVYAAVGLALAALGLLVYRKRHSEATGTTVAVYWARPIFKYGVAFCAALALGQLAYDLFFGQYRSNGDYSLPGTLACMAAAGLIGYFLAEMLLKKSFRVLRSGWKGALVFTAALVALGCAMSFDLTGYERWVPDASEVESVYVESYIYGNGGSIAASVNSENAIRLATAAHQALVNDKARQQRWNSDKSRRYYYDVNDELLPQGSFTVSYSLKNGRYVRRSYDMTLWPSERSDPSTPAGALEALYNDPDITLARTLGRYGYNASNDLRKLPDLRFTGGYVDIANRVNDDYRGEEERDLTPAEAQLIFDAVIRDVEAGHVSDSLFAYTPGMRGTLELYATYLDTRDYTSPVPSTSPVDENGRTQMSFQPVITESMTETLAVLRAMDIEIVFDTEMH